VEVHEGASEIEIRRLKVERLLVMAAGIFLAVVVGCLLISDLISLLSGPRQVALGSVVC
jgi:hypothetical protein